MRGLVQKFHILLFGDLVVDLILQLVLGLAHQEIADGLRNCVSDISDHNLVVGVDSVP